MKKSNIFLLFAVVCLNVYAAEQATRQVHEVERVKFTISPGTSLHLAVKHPSKELSVERRAKVATFIAAETLKIQTHAEFEILKKMIFEGPKKQDYTHIRFDDLALIRFDDFKKWLKISTRLADDTIAHEEFKGLSLQWNITAEKLLENKLTEQQMEDAKTIIHNIFNSTCADNQKAAENTHIKVSEHLDNLDYSKKIELLKYCYYGLNNLSSQ